MSKSIKIIILSQIKSYFVLNYNTLYYPRADIRKSFIMAREVILSQIILYIVSYYHTQYDSRAIIIYRPGLGHYNMSLIFFNKLAVSITLSGYALLSVVLLRGCTVYSVYSSIVADLNQKEVILCNIILN